jgi:YidC/Oxa1 family membrane protein insertase
VDLYSFAPIASVLDAAHSVVTGLADLLTPLVGASSTVLAIVLVTLALRLVLIPVGAAQARAEFTRRRLAPQLQQLQRRYTKHPEVLQRKTLELYTSEKASPLAGMLPTLAQAPVLSVVYGLFVLPTINGHANGLLTERLFGANLGTSLVGLLARGAVGPDLLVFACLLAAIAAVAWVSRVVSLRFAPTASASMTPATTVDAGGAAHAMARVTAVLSWLPFVTVLFVSLVPLAATLYLAVTTAWTLAERVVLRRRFAAA